MNFTYSMFKNILLYVLIVLIPFTHKEAFSFFDPDLVWSKYILIACAGIGIYEFFCRTKYHLKDLFFQFLAIFVFFQVLSLLQTQDIQDSLKFIGFQFSILFLYVFVKDYINRANGNLENIFKSYFVSWIVVLIFLVRQIYLQSALGIATGGVWPVPGYPTRYGATFWDVNHFGAYVSAGVFIILGYFLSIRKENIHKAWKVISITLIPVLLYILNLTGSRSSSIGFLFGLLVFVIIYLSKRKRLSIFVTNPNLLMPAGLGIVLSSFSLFYLLSDQIRAAFLYRAVSFYSHLFLLKVGIQVGIQDFLFGIGVNAFSSYFRSSRWAEPYYYIDRAALDLKLPLHNLWLEVLVETGLISFIGFLLFWAVLLYGLFRIYKSRQDYIALGLLSAITVYLVAGFFYSYKSEFFWFYAVLACAYVSYKFKEVFWDINILSKKNFIHGGIFLLSLISLLLPILLVTSPLRVFEINEFYSNPYAPYSYYRDLLELFRYVLGNYSFIGRFVSLVLYAGSVLTLLGFLRKLKVSIIGSFLVTACFFGVIGSFYYILGVSFNNALSLIMVMLFAVVGFFVLKGRDFRKSPYEKLIWILLVLIALNINTFYKTYRDSYPSDLNFLVELAANRGKTNNANIYIQEESWGPLVKYYSDHVERSENGWYNAPGGIITPVEEFSSFGGKDLLILKKDYNMELLQRSSAPLEVISQGDYKLVIHEVRAPK